VNPEGESADFVRAGLAPSPVSHAGKAFARDEGSAREQVGQARTGRGHKNEPRNNAVSRFARAGRLAFRHCPGEPNLQPAAPVELSLLLGGSDMVRNHSTQRLDGR
jgi:hypothetical protein